MAKFKVGDLVKVNIDPDALNIALRTVGEKYFLALLKINGTEAQIFHINEYPMLPSMETRYLVKGLWLPESCIEPVSVLEIEEQQLLDFIR